jgi:hypothetical protein
MIQLSVNTAKCLLKFASSDKTRPNIFGIGITKENCLAATDGFAAVEFTLPTKDPEFVGRVIDRKMFETSMKLAAVTKTYMAVNKSCLLEEQLVFPDITSIVPVNDFSLFSLVDSSTHYVNQRYCNESIRLDPQYLTLINLVAVACETETVSLSSVKVGQPLRFDVQGEKQSAIVVINHL